MPCVRRRNRHAQMSTFYLRRTCRRAVAFIPPLRSTPLCSQHCFYAGRHARSAGLQRRGSCQGLRRCGAGDPCAVWRLCLFSPDDRPNALVRDSRDFQQSMVVRVVPVPNAGPIAGPSFALNFNLPPTSRCIEQRDAVVRNPGFDCGGCGSKRSSLVFPDPRCIVEAMYFKTLYLVDLQITVSVPTD